MFAFCTRDRKIALLIMISSAMTNMTARMTITTQPSTVTFFSVMAKYETSPPSFCASLP